MPSEPVKCPECGSGNVTWEYALRNTASGVVDGRLKLNEIAAVCYAGCEDCSETAKLLDTWESELFIRKSMNDYSALTARVRRLEEALTEIARGVLDNENGGDYIDKAYRLARAALRKDAATQEDHE